MLLGNLERLVNALLDRYGRHDDDELGETVALVQLEDRTQVDIRLSGSRLHFHGEVARGQVIRGRHTVSELDCVQVLKDFFIEKGEPISDSEITLGERKPRLRRLLVPRDSELGPTDFLAAKKVAHGFNRLKLEIEVRFEVKLHVTGPQQTHRQESHATSPA